MTAVPSPDDYSWWPLDVDKKPLTRPLRRGERKLAEQVAHTIYAQASCSTVDAARVGHPWPDAPAPEESRQDALGKVNRLIGDAKPAHGTAALQLAMALAAAPSNDWPDHGFAIATAAAEKLNLADLAEAARGALNVRAVNPDFD